MPDTRTIAGVELVKVGVWDAYTSNGEPWTVTAANLADAVAAYEAGVALPVIKLGHYGTTNDAAPAMGTVTRLRLTDGGNTLVGDFTGVPLALATAMASEYPNRSVEGITNYTAPDGTLYTLLIEAVALLGATPPGVKGLAPVAVAASRVRFERPAAAVPPTVSRAVRVAAARRRRTQRSTKG